MKSDIIIGMTYLIDRDLDYPELGDATFFNSHPHFNRQVGDGLHMLIELVKVHLENLAAFRAFVILCLRHTTIAAT